ncbi:MFS transporter [Streptomyces decoyicus]|uniref:MFS transporter n=1 Tax=Streptomyces decoyicus TaxID=249567 RepID=A0ABZ1FV44_9ACTN|nr:MFS transporter [Streptomyces decoyicus]WSB73802.1 MFS transporter [Streptomyces decoyicus]
MRCQLHDRHLTRHQRRGEAYFPRSAGGYTPVGSRVEGSFPAASGGGTGVPVTSASAWANERPGVRRIAFAGLAGTTSQYFGFFSYALAAVIVFPANFFPEMDSAVASLTTFASIGVAFVVRPLGALVFGHFGDRSGRKSVLVFSLLMMAGATFFIGLLPGYSDLGVIAPVLLLILRVAQGAALGGGGMGAVLLAVEHAPPRRRGLYSAFPGVGASLGALLANGAFLALSGGLTPEQFRTWGWRIPFLFTSVLAGIAVFVRVSIPETPAFASAMRRAGKLRIPIAEVVRSKPRALLLSVGALVVGNVLYFVTQTFALSYGTAVLGIPDRIMLLATLTSIGVQSVVGFASAAFSDRLGRRRVCMAGALLCAVWAVPLIWLLRTRSPWLIVVGFSVSMFVYAIYSGPLSAYLAGLFATRLRFTAVALVFNTGVMVGGALAPTISDRLVAWTGSVWAVAGFVITTAALSLFSLWHLSESYPKDLGPDAEEEH